MRIIGILSSVMLIAFTSCAPKVYYQVFETEPESSGIKQQQNRLVYENDDCAVYYNFWGKGGDMGFRIENKTDQPLFLDMGKSYFVLNGTANDYFKQRVFSYSSGSEVRGSKTASSSRSASGIDYAGWLLSGSLSGSVTQALSSTQNYSVSIPEQQIVCVPAGTSKRISEFSIYDLRIRDCDLLQYPKRKEVSRVQFEKDNSPVVFENRLNYRVAEGAEVKINHRFHVSEISNMTKGHLFELRKEEFCGEESLLEKEFFKEDKTSPRKFYLRYNKGSDKWKH